MREIALHILDLLENAIRAGATVIAVDVEEEPDRDLLCISVEDNGPGLGVPEETAADPFFTTKEGKKTGLGLAMLKFRAEQAGELPPGTIPAGRVRRTGAHAPVERGQEPAG